MSTKTITKAKAKTDPLAAFREGAGPLTSEQVSEVLAIATNAIEASDQDGSRAAAATAAVASAEAALREARDGVRAQVREARDGATLLARAIFLVAYPDVRGEASIPVKGAAQALGMTTGRVSQVIKAVRVWYAATGSDRIPSATYEALSTVYKRDGAAALDQVIGEALTLASERAAESDREGTVRVTGADVSNVLAERAESDRKSEPVDLAKVVRQVDRWIDQAVRDGVAPGEVAGETADVAHTVARLAVLARAIEGKALAVRK